MMPCAPKRVAEMLSGAAVMSVPYLSLGSPNFVAVNPNAAILSEGVPKLKPCTGDAHMGTEIPPKSTGRSGAAAGVVRCAAANEAALMASGR